jgi:transposase
LAQFLEAHERAFARFGGHTREHLYDRPRTACYADATGQRLWNPTFKAFADYWGLSPGCVGRIGPRPRARTTH